MNVGLCGMAFIILLVLKLCDLVVVSWFIVFAPLMVMFAFWVLILLFLSIFTMYKVLK